MINIVFPNSRFRKKIEKITQQRHLAVKKYTFFKTSFFLFLIDHWTYQAVSIPIFLSP